MKLALGVILSAIPPFINAGTLTCKNEPCEQAAKAVEVWPTATSKGIPITDGPNIEITIPENFRKISRFESSVTFFYGPDGEKERAVSVMSLNIPTGKRNGPLGGWETLKKSENDGITAYFYKDTHETTPTYTAAMINKNYPSIDGSLVFLLLITRGYSEADFKAILGSSRPAKQLMPDH